MASVMKVGVETWALYQATVMLTVPADRGLVSESFVTAGTTYQQSRRSSGGSADTTKPFWYLVNDAGIT